MKVSEKVKNELWQYLQEQYGINPTDWEINAIIEIVKQ